MRQLVQGFLDAIQGHPDALGSTDEGQEAKCVPAELPAASRGPATADQAQALVVVERGDGDPGARGQFAAGLRRALNFAAHPRWLVDVALGGRPLVFGNLASYVASAKNVLQFRSWIDSQFDASVTGRDIEWLRREWPGTLIIKGILEPEDACAAADAGAQGIVVSNHGGRQLDSAPSTISALPRIADAVGGRLEVMMDGGIHGGQDVVKALALGAQSVMIGRAWVYALAARGEAGVRHVLSQMQRDIKVTLALTGLTSTRAVTSDILLSAMHQPD